MEKQSPKSNPWFPLLSYRLCTEGQHPLPLLNQWSYKVNIYSTLTSWSFLLLVRIVGLADPSDVRGGKWHCLLRHIWQDTAESIPAFNSPVARLRLLGRKTLPNYLSADMSVSELTKPTSFHYLPNPPHSNHQMHPLVPATAGAGGLIQLCRLPSSPNSCSLSPPGSGGKPDESITQVRSWATLTWKHFKGLSSDPRDKTSQGAYLSQPNHWLCYGYTFRPVSSHSFLPCPIGTHQNNRC